MNNKKLQKSISVLTTVTTTLWMCGAALLVPMASMAAVVDGDVVSPDAEFTEGDITYYPYDVFIVKIVGDSTFKRLVLNPEVFESYGHLEWGNIQTISAATVDGYVTSQLVRTDGDTKVYKLVPDGDTGTKEWMNMTAEEFGATYDWNSIYTVNSVDIAGYAAGSDVTTDDTDDPVVSEGTLTVSLAADTPASSIAVSSAARYPFTKINLTATGGDVIVDSMVIKRAGFGQDGAFSSVAVILDSTDGDQLGNNKSFNSTHETTLNDDLTVLNGTTKTIYLVGNMGTISTTYAGEVPALQLSTITLKDDATLNATLPITGNGMTLNGTITIGTATIADGNNNPSASTQNVGVTDYIVSSVKITANSTEEITVYKLVFTQDGSADYDDVVNVDLVDGATGVVLDTIAAPASKTLTFTPNITLGKGKNKSFDLRLDIVDGSARTISYDIDEQTDIMVKGKTYGYYITPTYTGITARPYYNAPDTTVGNGSLRIESLSVTPTNIAENKTSVVLGKFKFVAKGEEVKITSIGWNTEITIGTTASATTSDITNLTVYNEAGNAIAGPMDPTYDLAGSVGTKSRGAATTTDTIIVPVGESIYTVKADLSADFTANDTIQMSILPGNVTARGMTTDNSITPTPSTDVSSTALTVKAAALTVTVTSDPAAQTIIGGVSNFTFANYMFDATDSGADIKVTQVLVTVHTDATTYPALISDIDLFDGDTELTWSSYSEHSDWNSTANNEATTTITLNTNALVISAGTTKIIKVKADLGTGVTSGDISLGLAPDGVVAVDDEGNTVTETVTPSHGQSMTIAAGGTLNLSALTDPASGLVTGGSQGVSIGQFTLQAKYEDINVNYLGLTIAAGDGSGIDGDDDEISSISLYEDGVATALGTVYTVATTATITPSSTLTIPAGTTKNYTLKANFSAINDTTPATSGSGIRVKVSNLDATGVSAGSSSITVAGTDTNFSSFSAFKSIPTVTKLAFSGDDVITSNGVVSLYKFSVTANSAGPISLYKFTFGISTTTVSLVNTATDVEDTTGYYVYMSDLEGSLGNIVSQGTAAADGWQADMNASEAGSTANETLLETWFDVNNDMSGTGTEQIIINAGNTKYFTLRGTVKSGHDGTVNNESISTVFAGDATFAATTVKNANGVHALDQNDFIWSDLNADLYTSSTATVTAMFFNGYRISGLDNTSSTAQTITD
ncbi:hypothetical protein KKH35_01445 [Patescibacteria group bacterium]|nr:hypothetical protein [Patescibacteria group bacterium]